MNAEHLAEWFRRQGHTVARSASTYWVDAAPRILQAFPYHQLIKPAAGEVDALLKSQRAVAARYSTPLATRGGAASYHIVRREKPYELASLSKKARYDVRRAQREFEIAPITWQQLRVEGWRNRQETLQRQGRLRAEDKSWWLTLCNSAAAVPGFEAWGAIIENRVVASLLAFRCESWYYILYQQSESDYLARGVNNALTYGVTHEALNRPEIDALFYGLHSLDAPESVDAYKLRMAFEARPVRQRIHASRWVAPLFNRVTHELLRRAHSRFPDLPQLSKAEGLLRFYIEGLQPLERQNRPSLLDSQIKEMHANERQA